MTAIVDRPAADRTSIFEVPEYKGVWSWVSSVDHKQIGLMYIVTSLAFFVFGVTEAIIMRTQLIRPENQWLSPDTYNQIFTMHGTTMIFLVVMPMLIGFITYLVPLMIGARDMAFPRMNALSYLALSAGRTAALLQLFRRRGAGGGLVRLRTTDRERLLAGHGSRLLGPRSPGDRRRHDHGGHQRHRDRRAPPGPGDDHPPISALCLDVDHQLVPHRPRHARPQRRPRHAPARSPTQRVVFRPGRRRQTRSCGSTTSGSSGIPRSTS